MTCRRHRRPVSAAKQAPGHGGRIAHRRSSLQQLLIARTSEALLHVVTDADLRWHRAEDIDACAGVKAPHNWCIMLPLSQRVQPGVCTLMAMSRYRDALVRHLPPAEPLVYPPLVPHILTSCFDVLLLPPRPFRTEKLLTQDAFEVASVFF